MTNPEPVQPVALPCSMDNFAKVGVWERVTPPGIQRTNGSYVPNVVTNPLKPGEVIAATSLAGIYKSSDCGSTWTKTNTGRNAAIIDSGTPWLFAMDPVTPNVMYADTFGGSVYSLYKTTDGGVNWDPLWPDGSAPVMAAEYGFPELIDIDPTFHEHIIVNLHANCKAPHTPVCFADSNDMGATWRIIDGPPELTGWVEDASPLIVNAKTFLLGSTWTPLYLTTDGGATWKKVAGSGGRRLIQSNNMFYVAFAFGLQRSPDAVTWTDLPNTPGLIGGGLVSDGQTLFAASRTSGTAPYVTSPVTDGLTWSNLAPPAPLMNDNDGAYQFAIDTSHHILYSANQGSGLFRMVTQ